MVSFPGNGSVRIEDYQRTEKVSGSANLRFTSDVIRTTASPTMKPPNTRIIAGVSLRSADDVTGGRIAQLIV